MVSSHILYLRLRAVTFSHVPGGSVYVWGTWFGPVGNIVPFTPVFLLRTRMLSFVTTVVRPRAFVRCLVLPCGGLDENGSCRLCFNIWSPDGTVWKGLENIALLEKVCP